MSEMPEHIEYEKRVLLYCDVLGWKEVVKRSVNETFVRDSLGAAISEVKHPQDLVKQVKERQGQVPLGVEIAQVSDTVVVSCEDNAEGRDFICSQAADFVWRFLSGDVPLLCRGAIVTGLLYHQGNAVFGPGLTSAAELESKLAVYPRFLLADDFVGPCGEGVPIIQDVDGLRSLDVFCMILEECGAKFTEIWLQDARKAICGQLERVLDQRGKSKWSYAAQRFNDVLPHLAAKGGSPPQPIPAALMLVGLS
jgi:hypothetical protein